MKIRRKIIIRKAWSPMNPEFFYFIDLPLRNIFINFELDWLPFFPISGITKSFSRPNKNKNECKYGNLINIGRITLKIKSTTIKSVWLFAIITHEASEAIHKVLIISGHLYANSLIIYSLQYLPKSVCSKSDPGTCLHRQILSKLCIKYTKLSCSF